MTEATGAFPGELAELLRRRVAVALTGAGCSTESGIPDYRGPRGPRRERAPVTYREFVRQPRTRARYWARSSVGWLRVARAEPNPAHIALARLERGGRVAGVITQNVDGLHQEAGSRRVVELHGNLDVVRCLECGARASRGAVQRRLLALNPRLRRHLGRARGDGEAEIAPDGDARVPDRVSEGLDVPGCRSCGGVLKPDVVFFGESVPRDRVETAWELYEEAGLLLVVGSSLAVYSGYRFVLRAEEEEVPVAIVNLGDTRGDDAARARVRGRAGRVLPRLAGALVGRARTARSA